METTLEDLMRTTGRTTIHSVTPDNTLMQALTVMAEHNIGAVLVIEPSGALVGIFSERDYVRAVARAGGLSNETPVRELMTTNPVTVRPEQTVQECMIFVTERRIRHLPVTDNGGNLVNLVSIGDLVKASIAEKEFLIAEKQALISSLQNYISGTII